MISACNGIAPGPGTRGKALFSRFSTWQDAFGVEARGKERLRKDRETGFALTIPDLMIKF
jgi:hypothetical protein